MKVRTFFMTASKSCIELLLEKYTSFPPLLLAVNANGSAAVSPRCSICRSQLHAST